MTPVFACPPGLQRLYVAFAMEEASSFFRHAMRNVLSAVSSAAFFVNRRLQKEAVLVEDERVARFLGVIEERSKVGAEKLSLTFLPRGAPPVALLAPSDVANELLASLSFPGSVRVVGPSPSPLQVLANRDELAVALFCLVENAVDSVESRGHGTIEVRVSERDDGGVSVAVEDDGPAPANDVREKVFERFFTTKPGRVGVGLNIAARAVGRMHGTLALAPRDGGGTRAVIDLPSASQSTAAGRELRTLLVDDDEANRTTFAALLEERGHHVTEAGSLAEARARLAVRSYTLVVLDVYLGDGMGTSLIPEVRESQPDAKIVVMTGSGTPHVAGADLVVLKATEPSVVLRQIEKLVRPEGS